MARKVKKSKPKSRPKSKSTRIAVRTNTPPHRVKMHVVRVGGRWRIKQENPPATSDGYFGHWFTQAAAWKFARIAGKLMWSNGQKAQAVLHSRAGVIITEVTFGEDPVASKG